MNGNVKFGLTPGRCLILCALSALIGCALLLFSASGAEATLALGWFPFTQLQGLTADADGLTPPGVCLAFAALPAVGFLLLLDSLIPHLHLGSDCPEGRSCGLGKSTMLVLAVTLHNLPEGMAVGVVFAGALSGETAVSAAAAFALAAGIALQNVPEGAVISMPLVGQGMGKGRAFLALDHIHLHVHDVGDHLLPQRALGSAAADLGPLDLKAKASGHFQGISQAEGYPFQHRLGHIFPCGIHGHANEGSSCIRVIVRRTLSHQVRQIEYLVLAKLLDPRLLRREIRCL